MTLTLHRSTHIANDEEELCAEPDCIYIAEYMCGDCGRHACDNHLEDLEESHCAPCGLDVCRMEDKCNEEGKCGPRKAQAKRIREQERWLNSPAEPQTA